MNYEDKVFKKSNLEHNDSISTYDGWGAQQNPNVFEVFHNFLYKIKPKRILEIGTSIGGLTYFLNYTCKKIGFDCHILSYDIYEQSWYEDMIKNGIDVRVENVFNSNYTSVKDEVIHFIQQDGTTLILCDGGSKIHEFNLLSNYLKKGDLIMAHDYAENRIVFERDIYMKIWNWFEISDNDISDACLRNNLLSYDKEIFDKVVWVCKIKK
jgi:hypothetical protein